MAFNFLRILTSVLLFFSILFMPFWVSIILGLMAMIYFPKFWEAVMLFLLSDLLYGIRQVNNNPPIFISFIIALVVLILAEFLKKKVKFYN